MYTRFAVMVAVLTAPAAAQFSGLSASRDGSSVYFASALRLRQTAQPLNGKIFVASTEGVRLFAAREPTKVPVGSPYCTVAGFRSYLAAESSSTGVLALYYDADATGCTYPPSRVQTQLVTATGHSTVSGIVRLSASGRYAAVLAPRTARPFDPVNISILDLQAGTEVPVELSAHSEPRSIATHYSNGRMIADDGTAVIAVVTGFGGSRYSGYIVRPGSAPAIFPIPDVLPLSISSDGSKVVYRDRNRALHLLNLRTSESMSLASGGDGLISMSDDASRVVLVRAGRLHLIDTTGPADGVLNPEATTITEAALSGDGKVVYAVTDRGRLLKMDLDRGSQLEIVGETPYLAAPPPNTVVPGLATTLTGSGLSESVIDGKPPFDPFLGKLTMWVGERKVPVFQVGPDFVRFLVPWDVVGPVRMLAEVPGRNTPFDFPQIETTVPEHRPVAGAIARENWERTYTGPVRTGEIIHVFAIGLGPVTPEVRDGVPAPAEPLARISHRLTCSNSDTLYAGLAPGYVERVYQVDLRLGRTPGYQQFVCTLDGGQPFIFLTLNVVE
ncbi:MAG TPA: hypothetical protein VF135_01665 [Terriglobales bacterium]